MKNLILAICVSLTLGGCVSTYNPRTGEWTTTSAEIVLQEVPNTRTSLAAAELTYQAAITSVGDALDQGTLRPGSATAAKVGKAIKSARIALDAWHLVPDNATYAQTAVVAIQALTQVVTEVKR